MDGIEGEVEKIGKAVRTWMGRQAKREALAAVESISGGPAGDRQSEGNVAPNSPDLQHLGKEQIRQLYLRGQIRKLGA